MEGFYHLRSHWVRTVEAVSQGPWAEVRVESNEAMAFSQGRKVSTENRIAEKINCIKFIVLLGVLFLI